MNSTNLMYALTVAYVVIMGFSLYEQNFPRALYWFAATLLTVSILWGTR